MNKKEMIKELAVHLNVTQKEAKRHLEMFFWLAKKAMSCDKILSLHRFGTFYVSENNAQQIGVKPRKRVRFKAGTDLNSFVN